MADKSTRIRRHQSIPEKALGVSTLDAIVIVFVFPFVIADLRGYLKIV